MSSTTRSLRSKTKQPAQLQADDKKPHAGKGVKPRADGKGVQATNNNNPPVLTELGKRITALLAEKQMSQRALARAVGISQQSVNYLMWGRNPGDTPKSRHIARIADALGVDPLWLETGKGDRRGSGVITSAGATIGRRIPIKDANALLNPSKDAPVREMTADTAEPGAFGFDVTDGAMEPDVMKGDRLVVAPNRKFHPGDIVLALVDGSVELRRVRVTGTGKGARFELAPRHPDYPTFSSDNNDCKLLGVVTEQRRFIVVS